MRPQENLAKPMTPKTLTLCRLLIADRVSMAKPFLPWTVTAIGKPAP
jgi:hypothetical protein